LAKARDHRVKTMKGSSGRHSNAGKGDVKRATV